MEDITGLLWQAENAAKDALLYLPISCPDCLEHAPDPCTRHQALDTTIRQAIEALTQAHQQAWNEEHA